MLTRYLEAAMRKASYELLEEEPRFYGSIPGLQGVWAAASTLEECREELKEVLEEWVVLRLSRQLSIPVMEDIALTFRDVA